MVDKTKKKNRKTKYLKKGGSNISKKTGRIIKNLRNTKNNVNNNIKNEVKKYYLSSNNKKKLISKCEKFAIRNTLHNLMSRIDNRLQGKTSDNEKIEKFVKFLSILRINLPQKVNYQYKNDMWIPNRDFEGKYKSLGNLYGVGYCGRGIGYNWYKDDKRNCKPYILPEKDLLFKNLLTNVRFPSYENLELNSEKGINNNYLPEKRQAPQRPRGPRRTRRPRRGGSSSINNTNGVIKWSDFTSQSFILPPINSVTENIKNSSYLTTYPFKIKEIKDRLVLNFDKKATNIGNILINEEEEYRNIQGIPKFLDIKIDKDTIIENITEPLIDIQNLYSKDSLGDDITKMNQVRLQHNFQKVRKGDTIRVWAIKIKQNPIYETINFRKTSHVCIEIITTTRKKVEHFTMGFGFLGSLRTHESIVDVQQKVDDFREARLRRTRNAKQKIKGVLNNTKKKSVIQKQPDFSGGAQFISQMIHEYDHTHHMFSGAIYTPDYLFHHKYIEQITADSKLNSDKTGSQFLELIATSQLTQRHVNLLNKAFKDITIKDYSKTSIVQTLLPIDILSKLDTNYKINLKKKNNNIPDFPKFPEDSNLRRMLYSLNEHLDDTDENGMNRVSVHGEAKINSDGKLEKYPPRNKDNVAPPLIDNFKSKGYAYAVGYEHIFNTPSHTYVEGSTMRNETSNCTSFIVKILEDILDCDDGHPLSKIILGSGLVDPDRCNIYGQPGAFKGCDNEGHPYYPDKEVEKAILEGEKNANPLSRNNAAPDINSVKLSNDLFLFKRDPKPTSTPETILRRVLGKKEANNRISQGRRQFTEENRDLFEKRKETN